MMLTAFVRATGLEKSAARNKKEIFNARVEQ
jgi:hypothetical protein